MYNINLQFYNTEKKIRRKHKLEWDVQHCLDELVSLPEGALVGVGHHGHEVDTQGLQL